MRSRAVPRYRLALLARESYPDGLTQQRTDVRGEAPVPVGKRRVDAREADYGPLLDGSGAEIAGRLDALDASEDREDQDERAADA